MAKGTLQLSGKDETFVLTSAENTNYLYFPIAGEAGLKACVTPNLGGDSKLDQEHLQFALNCFLENTTKVRNIRQYLLTILFNAPVTIGSYYSALVRHDMYGI